MIGLIGLDHHWASASVRGRLTFSGERLQAAVRELVADSVLNGAVMLSTCNRTEVYVSTSDWDAARRRVERFLGETYIQAGVEQAVPSSISHRLSGGGEPAADRPPIAAEMTLPAEVAQVLYVYEDLAAARHLFRVASGLKSMVVGEAQILGQVKDALAASESAQAIDDELRLLMTHAIKAGKRVRAETEIGRADVSVASLAVRVAEDALGSLQGKAALIIGAGKTSQLCAHLLSQAGIGRLLLANRTSATASALADEVRGEPVELEDIGRVLPAVELVISATAAPHVVLSATTAAEGVRGRQTQLVMIDLAVPADIEESIGRMPQVTLYSLDALRSMDSTSGAAQAAEDGGRDAELARANELIGESELDYVRAQTMRLAVPGIAALRRHVDASEQAELSRALAQLSHLSPSDQDVVSRFGQRLVDKMFHHLVSRVRALAEYDEVPPEVTMRVLAQLFADPDTPSGHDAG